MQHFKIIETENEYADVLMYRDRNEDGKEIVRIMAVGIIDGEENMFADEEIQFENYKTACSFIRDFGRKAAEEWCHAQDVMYW
ncbi:MAG: hypothetical protein ACTHK0_01865 [Ginsengibacter sp.]